MNTEISLMFDYQEISLYTGKDTPNLAYLTPTHSNLSWDWYRLDWGVQPLKVGYSASLRLLAIKGSIPYFSQGHNARHGIATLRENWKYVGALLGVSLFCAVVDVFEYGVICESPYPLSTLLQHHSGLPAFKTKAYQKTSGLLEGKEFISPGLKVKLYDPLANYRAKRLSKASYSQVLGLSVGEHYLKLENHYRKPELHFKRKVLLTDFFNPTFQQLCKDDLMETYRKIRKTRGVALPTDKARLSTANILLVTLQELALEYGINVEESVYGTLSRIPADVLTKDDRKARKKQFRKMLEEVSSGTETSPFDLSEALLKSLNSN